MVDLEVPRQLLARALACGALARLFAPLSEGAISEEALVRLRKAAEALESEEVMKYTHAFVEDAHRDPEGYRREYVRLFVRGEVPPYEASSGTPTAPLGGPNVQLLADVAGFYRAFGFQARGERPDHLAAELEFLALLCLLEARAHLAGQAEEARVCADARKAFLRDHLLSWIASFEENVTRRTECSALRHLVRLTARLVQMDAAERPPR
ncbi:MAG: molecular chaperone TorD family protein [Armatimonadota bacterium]|nr:molecular chaperone TorD family protein [Armatimonadota bacterium]